MDMFYVLLTLYLVLLIGVLLFRSSVSKTDHIFGNRNYGTFATGCSLVAGFRDGAGITVWLTLALAYGYGLFSLWVGVLVGMIIVASLSAGIRHIANEEKLHSIDEVIGNIYGDQARFLALVVVFVAAFFFACAQIFVVGKVVSAYTPLAEETAKAIVTALLVGYLIFGRYAALIRTDVLQWIFVITLLVCIFIVDKDVTVIYSSSNIPLDLAVGLGLLSALILCGGPDTWQRMFSAQDDSVAKKGAFLAASLYLIFAILFLGAASVFSGVDLNTSGEGNVFLEMRQTDVSGLVLAFFGTFVIISAMSTADSHFFAVSTALDKAISKLKKSASGPGWNMNGALIAMVGAGAFVATTYIVNIVDFLFDSLSIVTILVPFIVIAAIAGKKASAVRFPGSIMTVGVLSYGYVFLYVDGILWNLVPFVLTSVLLLGSRFSFTDL
jgi:SSS family solute:Na+ symporter